MTAETTTPAGALRELAIAAAERQEREVAERNAAEYAEELETVVRWAARHAVQILGEVADGAEWTALDAETAWAWIGDEPFRYRHRDGRWLYHVTTCPTCGKGRTAGVFTLEGLGALLRGIAPDAYVCETCEAVVRDQQERAAAARREAAAALPPLPTREAALRAAVTFAGYANELWQLSGERHQAALEAGAAAQVSQAWSAIARAIEQQCETYGVGA